jgi:hypothetical protein
VKLVFLNKPLLKKCTEKEIWDESGRDGESKKRGQNRLMPNPRSEEDKINKNFVFLKYPQTRFLVLFVQDDL